MASASSPGAASPGRMHGQLGLIISDIKRTTNTSIVMAKIVIRDFVDVQIHDESAFFQGECFGQMIICVDADVAPFPMKLLLPWLQPPELPRFMESQYNISLLLCFT